MPLIPNGIDCSKLTAVAKKQNPTNYESQKMTWISFRSTDLISDHNFSIDIGYTDYVVNYNLPEFVVASKSLIERQLKVIDKVATLWKESTKLMSKFWSEAGAPFPLKEVEDIVDSNSYPQITDPYFKLWNHDESTMKRTSKELDVFGNFLAAVVFSICDASSLLLLELVNSGVLWEKIFDNQENNAIYQGLRKRFSNVKFSTLKVLVLKQFLTVLKNQWPTALLICTNFEWRNTPV